MGMADGKPRTGRRWALGLGVVCAVWLLGVWPPPGWWRGHWPRATAMMRWTEARGGAPAAGYRPTPLEEISPVLVRMVIIAEDSRFRTHAGIDPAELREAAGVPPEAGWWETVVTAWRRRDRMRGASTITQQLAKNLYLSPDRNPLRKLKEAVTALRLDAALSKDRILELYLNTVEWGPGIWGVEAASRAYFGVGPGALDATQAASLAATLPHPRSSNPLFQPERMVARRTLILARYYGADVGIPRVVEPDTLVPVVVPIPLPEIGEVPLPDSLGLDSLRLDSLRLDSISPDSLRRDSLPPQPQSPAPR